MQIVACVFILFLTSAIIPSALQRLSGYFRFGHIYRNRNQKLTFILELLCAVIMNLRYLLYKIIRVH